MSKQTKTVVILSITSDIGGFIARRYLSQGWRVIGTYRTKKHGVDLLKAEGCTLFHCDLADKKSVAKFIQDYKRLRSPWDVFISCAGDLLPAQAFFDCDFDQWARSVEINSLQQLRILHGLFALRRKGKVARAVLFAGGGMNGAVVNLSAYTISKILLTKMCEFLDAENKDLSVLIVGPGFTRTKIHDQILEGKAVAPVKLKTTRRDLKEKEGTALSDIFECIDWLIHADKNKVSGRNFSVAFDPWKSNPKKLLKALKSDRDMYRLRRKKNDSK